MLAAEQARRLAEADRILASQAGRFYQAIRRIADLAAWRQQEGAPPQEWWWYLDVLAQAPAVSQAQMAAVPAYLELEDRRDDAYWAIVDPLMDEAEHWMSTS